jgi:hypothetical protein
MLGPHGGLGAVIKGDSGYITAAGAKAAVISRWNIRRSGSRPDGSPILRFRAQFEYVNDVLMNLKQNGVPLPKRVVVQMQRNDPATMRKLPVESIDILGWEEWKYEDGILTLENILRSESSNVKFHSVTR